jgi:ABC-type multidrug transport system fused ATPase/permease subunit
LQHAEVLDGTVHDNIAFGGAFSSREDVIEAATNAQLHDIVMGMPEKYDTVIGPASKTSMSGGQLARLSLARALCRKPKLLLIDEVTSPLDAKTETDVLAPKNGGRVLKGLL